MKKLGEIVVEVGVKRCSLKFLRDERHRKFIVRIRFCRQRSTFVRRPERIHFHWLNTEHCTIETGKMKLIRSNWKIIVEEPLISVYTRLFDEFRQFVFDICCQPSAEHPVVFTMPLLLSNLRIHSDFARFSPQLTHSPHNLFHLFWTLFTKSKVNANRTIRVMQIMQKAQD